MNKTKGDTLSFCNLPEITEEALADEIYEVGIEDDAGPFYKQYRCVFGWVAQTAYVSVLFTASPFDHADATPHVISFSGAQVGVASFAVNYLVDQGIGISQSRASNLFSYCQMTFTAGRWVTTIRTEAAQLFIAVVKIHRCCDIELGRPGTTTLHLRRCLLHLCYLCLTTQRPSRCGMLVHAVLL